LDAASTLEGEVVAEFDASALATTQAKYGFERGPRVELIAEVTTDEGLTTTVHDGEPTDRPWALSLGRQLTDGRQFVMRSLPDGRYRVQLVTGRAGTMLAGARRARPWLVGAWEALPWPDAAEMTTWKLQSEEHVVHLQRTGSKWRFVEPAHSPVDAKAIDRMLTALRELRPGAYVDVEQADDAMSDRAWQRLTWTTGRGEQVVMQWARVGNNADVPDADGRSDATQLLVAIDWPGQAEGVMVRLPLGVADLEQWHADQFRDRRPFVTLPTRLRAIERAQDGSHQRLEKNELGQWLIVADDKVMVADTRAVQHWLDYLTSLQATGFRAASEAGLNTADGKPLTLTMQGASQRAVSWSIGRNSGAGHAAETSEERGTWVAESDKASVGYVLSPEQWLAVSLDLRRLRARQIWAGEAKPWQRMVLNQADHRVVMDRVAGTAGRQWIVRWADQRYETDGPAWLAEAVTRLEAARWLLPEEASRAQVNVTLSLGWRPARAVGRWRDRRLPMWEHSTIYLDTARSVAWLDDDDQPFVVDRQLIDLLTREYRDTRLTLFRRDELASLRSSSGHAIVMDETGRISAVEGNLPRDRAVRIVDLMSPMTVARLAVSMPEDAQVVAQWTATPHEGEPATVEVWRAGEQGPYYARSKQGMGLLDAEAARSLIVE